MASRYDFSGAVSSEIAMTRGKPIPVGPVVPAPGRGQELDRSSRGKAPRRSARAGLFPLGFMPLSHPLHTVGHQLFPESWTKVHPDHERFDVEFDIPDTYLPEFPPPMFLTTRPDLGDVSRGHEIAQANFRELFDGIITPEQMEGLRLLVTKFPTTWFNQTKHRVTEKPVRGTACFDCHVNGHTNGAIEMDPALRPTLLRDPARNADTSREPQQSAASARGGRSARSTTSPRSRSISTAISASNPQIGGRQLDRASTNRMGDFNSIIAWPPAPKLDRFGRLIASKATPTELRGEALFPARPSVSHATRPRSTRTTRCTICRIEEFYPGRARAGSRPSRCEASRTRPRTSTMAACQPSTTPSSSSIGVRTEARGATRSEDLVAFLYTL